MNTETNTQGSSQKRAEEDTVFRAYRPRLSFYHANGKGTGSAVQFEVIPACGDREGVVFMTLAQQKSVAIGSAEQGTRQHATFDWKNRVTVKLNFNDLCQMLLVFRGLATAIQEGKGLYHDSRNMTTMINVTRQVEPYPGLSLEISRRGKTEGDVPLRIRIIFNAAETLGLGTVLEQQLGVVAFGIPKEATYSTGAAQVENDQMVI
jgi:hypothetical protein